MRRFNYAHELLDKEDRPEWFDMALTVWGLFYHRRQWAREAAAVAAHEYASIRFLRELADPDQPSDRAERPALATAGRMLLGVAP